MSWIAIVLGVLAVLLGVWLWLSADRLDRLHHRLDLARESLATQLSRRVAAVQQVAASGALDDAESLLLLDAAARAGEEHEPGPAQSALSQALRAVFDSPHECLEEDLLDLAAACRRVELARRFHNDLVSSVRLVRGLPQVRFFRLAGRAPEPTTIDLDDQPPTTF